MHTRRILLFTVLLLMTPALATGSTARLEGLGVIPDFVEDYANMFTYPVSITRYPAVVVGEIGGTDSATVWGRGFGATMGVGEDNMYGVFGIMLRENCAFSPVPGIPGAKGSQFDLLWGMNFTDVSLGLRLERATSELKSEDGVETVWSPIGFRLPMVGRTVNEVNTMAIGFSVGFEVRESDMVEATFEYRTLDFKIDEITAEYKIEDKGEPSYAFSGRGFFALEDGRTLVPVVSYAKYDGSWEIDAADPAVEDSADETITMTRAGLGYQIDIGSLLMVGIGYSQWKAEGENSFGVAVPVGNPIESYELTSSSGPFFFGCLETPVTNWLTVRFGAMKNLISEDLTVEYVDGTKEEISTKNGVIPDDIRAAYEADDLYLACFQEPFTFSMGVGFHFGDLDIDATLNQFYPFTGMYWLSGVGGTVPFGRISATYHY